VVLRGPLADVEPRCLKSRRNVAPEAGLEVDETSSRVEARTRDREARLEPLVQDSGDDL
jgi:hypothetical protein